MVERAKNYKKLIDFYINCIIAVYSRCLCTDKKNAIILIKYKNFVFLKHLKNKDNNNNIKLNLLKKVSVNVVYNIL